MIVASFLLIPVAVLFVALGLINGSSSLLIASIVVSLSAAVTLVIGLRQAAARRVEVPLGPEPAVPMPGSPTRGDRPDGDDETVVDASADDSAPGAAAFAGDSASYRDPDLADQAGPDRRAPRAGRAPPGARRAG